VYSVRIGPSDLDRNRRRCQWLDDDTGVTTAWVDELRTKLLGVEGGMGQYLYADPAFGRGKCELPAVRGAVLGNGVQAEGREVAHDRVGDGHHALAKPLQKRIERFNVGLVFAVRRLLCFDGVEIHGNPVF